MKAPESKKAQKSKIIFAVASVLFILTLFTCTELVGLPPKPEYTVTYYLAGGTGTPPIDDTVYAKGASVFIKSALGASKAGYVFRGWMTDDSLYRYKPGEVVKITKDLLLKAKWDVFDDPNSNVQPFNVKNITDGSWYTIQGARIASTDHCVVYADINDSWASASQAQELANTYERYIHTPFQTAFGNYKDVETSGDAKNKVMLLMVDLIDGYTGRGDYAAAVFDETHMRAGTNSNNHDMIFVDTTPGLRFFDETCVSMAHEMQHLINWSQTQGLSGPRPKKETWLDEGLSVAAERLYLAAKNSQEHYQIRSHLDYYNDSFLSSVQKPLNSIARGNTFLVWDDGPDGDLLAERATAYLFFEWLRLQSGGTAIFKDIITHNSTGVAGVVAAARSRITAMSGADWTKIYGSWLAANAVNDSSSIYGYKGKFTLERIAYSSGSGDTRSLLPGEFVQSQISMTGDRSPAQTQGSGSNHIFYIGISSANVVDIDFNNTVTGKYAISFNANTAINGSAEMGSVLGLF
ncbi:MAG: hypothetical protein Ta2A_05320 [Treponemataceae bacterium]|nr:MAG: hypothetical protein Ta2A_05320 [Treponemataceae bacterium]